MRLEIEVWDIEHWELTLMNEEEVVYNDVVYWRELESVIAELKSKFNFQPTDELLKQERNLGEIHWSWQL